MGLNKELRFLLVMTVIFSIINSYIGIFINLYIWKANHSITQVAWFNITMLVFWCVAFTLGGKLFTLYSLRLTTRIASVVAALAFLFLLTLGGVPVLVWDLCIGGCVGVMCGTYYVSQNMMISSFGDGEDFRTFFSLNSIVQLIVSVVNPILCAVIINWFGYSGSFIIMLAFVCILFTLTFFIPNIRGSKEDKEKPFFRIRHPLQRLNQLKFFFLSCILMGLVLQFQGLFTQLFTFAVSDNNLIIAGLNVSYTLLTILALEITRRTQIQGIRWLQLGGFLVIVGYLIALHPSKLFFVIMNICSTLGFFFVSINWNANQFSFLSQFQSTALTKSMIGRELTINIGRTAMLCFIAQVHDLKGSIYEELIAFTIVCVGLLILVESKLVLPQIQSQTARTEQEISTVDL
ncbi:MAG: transporter [Bacilli bacterium]|nr:transporter [Bacilli bacterium]